MYALRFSRELGRLQKKNVFFLLTMESISNCINSRERGLVKNLHWLAEEVKVDWHVHYLFVTFRTVDLICMALAFLELSIPELNHKHTFLTRYVKIELALIIGQN